MGKLNDRKHLDGQRTSRSLLAITLAASLAAFGCTTNQNLGNGTPTRSGPEIRRAPTSGVTTGGETSTPPPMTSSYTRAEALPSVTPKTLAAVKSTSRIIRRSPDEAAAIMAQHAPVRGRYLGVVNPGSSGRGYVSANLHTGQFQNPAMIVNPQITINSSISSPPTPAINSGAGGVGGVDASAALTTGGTTAAATITGTDVAPTTAAAGLAPGTFAGASTLPTIASSGIPTVTAASAGLGRSTVGVNGTAAVRTATGTTATTAAATATAATAARTGTVAPIRVLRGTNGSVTVTNTSTATGTGTTATGRNQ